MDKKPKKIKNTSIGINVLMPLSFIVRCNYCEGQEGECENKIEKCVFSGPYDGKKKNGKWLDMLIKWMIASFPVQVGDMVMVEFDGMDFDVKYVGGPFAADAVLKEKDRITTDLPDRMPKYSETLVIHFEGGETGSLTVGTYLIKSGNIRLRRTEGE